MTRLKRLSLTIVRFTTKHLQNGLNKKAANWQLSYFSILIVVKRHQVFVLHGKLNMYNFRSRLYQSAHV